MNEDEFFARLADFLEDALPESVFLEKQLMNKIVAIIRHEDPRQNFNMLSLLRAWCRKMEVRLRIESDKRLRVGPYADLQALVKEQCLMLAEKVLPFFKVPELLPLACQACTELLRAGGLKATPLIVTTAMSMTYVNPMKIALLELISMSDTYVDDLPLLDPIIARKFTDLHGRLIKVAPEHARDEVTNVVTIISRIEEINAGNLEVDRDFLEFCDIPRIYKRTNPKLMAGHPANSVRAAFYKCAVETKAGIGKFMDEVICAGLFDQAVSGMAIELVASHLAMVAGRLTHKHMAHLQCMPMKENSALFAALGDAIDAADDFTLACSWIRFLYHKEPWVVAAAKAILSDVFQFDNSLDVTRQPECDYFAKTFLDKLRNPGEIEESAIGESLFEIVICDEQPDDIKRISAARLAEIILDPYKDVRALLPDLRCLPFALFPDLLHAVAIRDGSWQIDSLDRVVELVRSLNQENAAHLLPILSRIVFQPLTNVESDGANTLRLPLFVENRFQVRGSCGFFTPVFYEPTKPFPLAPIVDEWMKVTLDRQKPICEGFDVRLFTSLVVGNKGLARDILAQIDDEDSAAAKLAIAGPPHMILYFLLLCVNSCGKPSTAAAKMCAKMGHEAITTALKLNQSIVEYGGDCPLPESITDCVLDPMTRRAALSLLTTHLKFRKEITNIDFDKVAQLLDETLPVNVTRQIASLLMVNAMERAAVKLCEQKDAVTKSLAFHQVEPTSETVALALVCASSDREAICSKAAATELIYRFCMTNPVPSQNLAALFHANTGETLL